MSHLIDSYSPMQTDKNTVFQTVTTYNGDHESPYLFSIIIKNVEDYSINRRILEAIKSIELFEDNWDEMDALKPNAAALKLARLITLYMEAIGQAIFSIAPGPMGEIMLDFRNKGRSFELLFYPDRNKYVKFYENGDAEQDVFTPNIILPELLTWLNAN